jgi:geranylgeranyl pyrophosphate synthase
VLFEGGVPRIRPVLLLLASRAAERETDPHAALEVAMIAELLHTSVRLHDAALGARDGRRRRAARRVLGGAAHWLGAHHVSLRALELARRAPAPEILGDALDALREVSEGQAFAESLRGRRATVADAMLLAEGRSGAVFSFSCRAGARLGRAERPMVTSLARYGRHVGVAVQVADELAALERAEDWRGICARAAMGRPLVPVVAAAERDAKVWASWVQLSGRPDRGRATELLQAVRELGGLGAGREALALQAWSAQRALSSLPPTPTREALSTIASSLARSAA